MKMKKLNKKQKDSIREVANIGSGNASTTLAKLIGEKVSLYVPSADVVPITEISKLVGGSKQLIVGVYSSLTGALVGNVIMIFPKKDALILTDFMSGREPGSTTSLSKAGQEKIVKIGDVTATSYLQSISTFLETNIKHGKSKIVSTFGESIIDFVTLGLKGQKYALVLRAETGFNLPNLNITGEFVLVLAVENIDKLIVMIDKKIGK